MNAPTPPFPQLFHARPEWPNQDDEHLFWVGLNSRFQFSHHPVKNQAGAPGENESFFCRPALVADQLLGVLKDSKGGGSILVTGYRGTGKTSLVNHCLRVWQEEREVPWKKKKGKGGGKAAVEEEATQPQPQPQPSDIQTNLNRKVGEKKVQMAAVMDWEVQKAADRATKTWLTSSMLKKLGAGYGWISWKMRGRRAGEMPGADVAKITQEVKGLADAVVEAVVQIIRGAESPKGAVEAMLRLATELNVKLVGNPIRPETKAVKSKQATSISEVKDGRGARTLLSALKQANSESEVKDGTDPRCVAEALFFEVVGVTVNETVDRSVTSSRVTRRGERSYLKKRVREAVDGIVLQAQRQVWTEVDRWMQAVQVETERKEKVESTSAEEMAENPLLIVKVNMATVTCAHDVLLLAFESLRAVLEKEPEVSGKVQEARRRLKEATGQLRSVRRTEHWAPRVGIDLTGSEPPAARGEEGGDGGGEHTFEREALSRYQAILVAIIEHLEAAGLHPVFVFDEVDKLMPLGMEKPGEAIRALRNLVGLQKIVAELKFFLSESPSHQIFIAGKDVDDSWAEDQNKGEGIFESIFAANIQVASIFTLELEPCLTPLPEGIYTKVKKPGKEPEKNELALAFYEALAGQLGIAKNSLVIRTALLILPYLAEYEIVHLLQRGKQRVPQRPDKAQFEEWLKCYLKGAGKSMGEGQPNAEKELAHPCRLPEMWVELAPMSERTCRRLRILLEYLTYKGRGIPRKILREFYGMVRPVSSVPMDDPGYWKLWEERPPKGERGEKAVVRYVLSFPQHHLQKMNFYAGIVEHLDESFNLLRGLNDKGRVSIFHIVDYLLKFYTTGFSHRDLEHAPFMTDREELFPSRQLATLILRLMDGRLWRRKDSRGADYRMLHHVAHDLGVMFLRYSPEQMELRHTLHDFREEMPPLQKLLDRADGVATDRRLAPIHAQMRLARINELCGRHYDARLAYYTVLRWLRQDVTLFEQAGATLQLTKSASLAVMPPHRNPTGAAEPPQHTADFCSAFVGYAVETHLALGRLLEEVGELRVAIQHYEEASAMSKPYIPKPRLRISQEMRQAVPQARELFKTLFESSEKKVWVGVLASLLARKPPMQPLQLSKVPLGYVQVCNSVAIAYSKLWERASANEYLLRALFHLDAVGDEYGLVDQMFFIGQVMVRRRDLQAAALWYRAALKKATAIRVHSSPMPDRMQTNPLEPQTSAGWQTPPISSTTVAQIFAALGDVTYATGGHVFCKTNPGQEIWKFVKQDLMSDMKPGEKPASIMKVDDRWEEHFFTRARRSFDADNRDGDARDVYLRQLEARFSRFEQAACRLDRQIVRNQVKNEYVLLNAWTTFWRGARVLMHRNLNVLTSLSRDQTHEWGRVGDFRRMGTLLRLVGAMLVELGLRAGDAPSRQLLVRASALLQKEGKGGVLPAANQFYKQFVSDAVNLSSKQPGLDAWMYELAELLGDLGATSANYRNKDWWNDRARINVNMAAQDILLIFAWIGDRSDLLRAEIDIANDVEKAGPRSPLCRLNGQEEEHPINGAPIAYLNRKIKWDSRRPLVANLHFKLLAIAEKALLSSYLCYRDCIPDYSYAQSCIQLGELYSVTLYKLGIWSKSPTSKDHNDFDNVLKTMAEAIHFMTEYAKRFLLKAVDVLKREQEQNRNTFHLMSEAYFNLGDILLIRLLALTESADPMPCDIFSSGLQEALKRLFENLKSKSEGKAARDVYPEDLRRQIIAAYQQGLKCVQDEMNDHHSRFRVPADVYYSNRNVMDPVLHFRICRSVRLRHQGGRADSQSEEELYREFERRRRVISDLISGDESPQSFGLKHDMNTNDVPTMAWVKYLKKVVEFVNEVRTDRGPLKWTATDEGIDAMTWNTDGDAPAPHGRFVFFANLSK